MGVALAWPSGLALRGPGCQGRGWGRPQQVSAGWRLEQLTELTQLIGSDHRDRRAGCAVPVSAGSGRSSFPAPACCVSGCCQASCQHTHRTHAAAPGWGCTVRSRSAKWEHSRPGRIPTVIDHPHPLHRDRVPRAPSHVTTASLCPETEFPGPCGVVSELQDLLSQLLSSRTFSEQPHQPAAEGQTGDRREGGVVPLHTGSGGHGRGEEEGPGVTFLKMLLGAIKRKLRSLITKSSY